MDCRLGVNVQWAKCLNAAKEATNKKIMPCRLTQAHFLAGPEDPATLQLLLASFEACRQRVPYWEGGKGTTGGDMGDVVALKTYIQLCFGFFML